MDTFTTEVAPGDSKTTPTPEPEMVEHVHSTYSFLDNQEPVVKQLPVDSQYYEEEETEADVSSLYAKLLHSNKVTLTRFWISHANVHLTCTILDQRGWR